MEFITEAILSGLVYDMLKQQITLTSENLKHKFKDWIIDDDSVSRISDELAKLDLSDKLRESAIEKRLMASPQIMSLIKSVKVKSEGNTIVQNHSGSGDNIGRDKITK